MAGRESFLTFVKRNVKELDGTQPRQDKLPTTCRGSQEDSTVADTEDEETRRKKEY